MSLEKLAKQGRLRKTPTSKQEISGLLTAAECHLSDAGVDLVSLDGRFLSAYAAVLQTATALLRCHGYRTGGVGHHLTTFEALSIILGPSRKSLVAYFNSCRSKRNKAQYHSVGLVTSKELQDLMGEAEQFLRLARQRIAEAFPQYSPDQ